MSRLAPSLLGAAAVLFVAGIATKLTAVVLLSLLAAAAMLLVLGMEDRRAARESSDQAPVTSGATPTPRATEDEVIDVRTEEELAGGAVATKAEPVTELLATVPGVGPAKVEALAAAFPTAEQLRSASKDELTAVNGVGPALAERIQSSLV